MTNLPRSTALVALTAGLLWTVKCLVIIARDGSFDPLEGVLFLGGLAALLLAGVLVGLHLASGRGAPTRVVMGGAGVIAAFVATVALEALGKAIAQGLYDGDNLGLREEGGILLAGLAWVAFAGSSLRRGGHVARPEARAVHAG